MANISGQEYTLIAFGSSNKWETWSRLADVDGTECTSPIYTYIGSKFKYTIDDYTFIPIGGEYSATIYFELYHE